MSENEQVVTDAMIDSIVEQTLFCTFTASVPMTSARKHRQESKRLNEENNTGDKAKALITPCDHPTIHELQKCIQAARAYYTLPAVTRPTIVKGFRMVQVTKELDLANEMGKFRDVFNKTAPLFFAVYPQLKADAPAALGRMYDPSMWPDLEEIKAKCVCELKFLPCPKHGEWRSFLAASCVAARESLKAEIAKRMDHLAQRCRSSGPLYQSAFSNVAELLDLVPEYNQIPDPQLVAAVQAAEEIVALDRDDVRDDEQKRKQVADRADQLVGLFGGLNQVQSEAS